MQDLAAVIDQAFATRDEFDAHSVKPEIRQAVETCLAHLDDGSLRFQGELPRPSSGGSYLDRTTLTPNPDATVRQHIEVSADGTAWRSVFDATYVRATD